MAVIEKALEPFKNWNPKPLSISAPKDVVSNQPVETKDEYKPVETESTTEAKIATEQATAPVVLKTPSRLGYKATPDNAVDSTYLDNLSSIDLNWKDPRHREKLLKIQRDFEWNGKGSGVSSAGAVGPAQFMPQTWKEAKTRGWVPPNASARDPHWAAVAQEKYMDWIYDQPAVSSANTEADRVKRMLAAYNNGIGNVANAVSNAKEDGYPTNWYRYLSRGSQKETINYTQNILKKFNSGNLLVVRKHGGILYNNNNNKSLRKWQRIG